jgi:hypothetical protein
MQTLQKMIRLLRLVYHSIWGLVEGKRAILLHSAMFLRTTYDRLSHAKDVQKHAIKAICLLMSCNSSNCLSPTFLNSMRLPRFFLQPVINCSIMSQFAVGSSISPCLFRKDLSSAYEYLVYQTRETLAHFSNTQRTRTARS